MAFMVPIFGVASILNSDVSYDTSWTLLSPSRTLLILSMIILVTSICDPSLALLS